MSIIIEDAKLAAPRGLIEHFNEKVFSKIPSIISCCVAGGAVRDCILEEEPKDYDLFFESIGDYMECHDALVFDQGGTVIYDGLNNKSIEFPDGTVFDLVKIFRHSAKSTIECFDFTACMFAVDRENVYRHSQSVEHLLDKKLVLYELVAPVATLYRIPRYIEKGFSISRKDLRDLAYAINEMDDGEIDKHDTDYSEFVSSMYERL